jgi:hypothetical protein
MTDPALSCTFCFFVQSSRVKNVTQAFLPCLLPLETLKKIRDQTSLYSNLSEHGACREELREGEVFPLKEYRLHGKPQSLKAFLDLFLLSGEWRIRFESCYLDSG